MSCSKCHPTWKRVLAFAIDFVVAFWVFGYVIARVTGATTEGGFQLEGVPALVAFALIVGYFVVMNRFFGGTFGKKLLGIAKEKH